MLLFYATIERKTITLTMKYLGCSPGLANENECLVLSQVAIVLLTDDSLQSAELLPHIHRFHAQEVAEVCM